MSLEFHWGRDYQGEFLPVKTNAGDINLRPDGQTSLFMFVGKFAVMSHIWYERPDLGQTEDTVMGMRIWKQFLDDKYGEGAFMTLCEDMMDRGFPLAEDKEPSELDMQAYYQTFPDAPALEPNKPSEFVENGVISLKKLGTLSISEMIELWNSNRDVEAVGDELLNDYQFDAALTYYRAEWGEQYGS